MSFSLSFVKTLSVVALSCKGMGLAIQPAVRLGLLVQVNL